MAGAGDDTGLERLFRLSAEAPDLGARMRAVAGALVGRPYVSHPLIGGPDRKEELVLGVTGFDCVTFVETVLAVGRTTSPAEAEEELVQLRYRNGVVAWEERLHYFSDWLVENERRQALQIVTGGPGAERIETSLSVLEGLPPRKTSFLVVPAERLEQATDRIADGCVVAFASEREGLDYFHVGLLLEDEVAGAPGLELVHAGRSSGAVAKEPLAEFLARNQTRGLSFARPLARGETSA